MKTTTRKIVIPLILIMAIIALMVPAYASQDKQKYVVLSLMKYDPVPAEPGNFVDVYLLVNNPRDDLKNLKITFKPEYPFSVSEDEPETQTIPTLPSLKDTIVKYRLLVDIGARNHDYNMTWYYQFNNQPGIFQYEAPVTVQATDASLTVDHYEVTPHPVRPGANATLTLSLKNNGKLTLKDIDVNLDLSGSLNSFSTFGTGTLQRIEYIAPQESKEVNYQLISDPKAENRVHNFPVSLQFRDERNNKYNTSSRISIIANAPPRILVMMEDSKLTAVNDTNDVTFKIVNNGASDLKFLTLRLEPSNDYKILTPSTTNYLGNLDADDFETADFKVKANVASPSFLMTIDYADPYNNRYNQTFMVPLNILDLNSTTQSSNWKTPAMIIVALLFLGVAYFAWRKLKDIKS